MSLFVDTSVWYAAADSSDISNARAKAILANSEPLVTTDHVLVETWTLLRYRVHRQAAGRIEFTHQHAETLANDDLAARPSRSQLTPNQRNTGFGWQHINAS